MKIPVSALYKYCQQMLDEKWGYIYGQAGALWTPERQRALEAAYADDDPNYGLGVKYGGKWIGHHVTDCSGVMVYIWSLFSLKIPHGSSSMVKSGYITDCSSKPKPGYAALVDPTPDTADNNHIGIVLADGVTVFEAKGTIAGCVTSKVTDSKWTKFGRFKDVLYEEVKPLNTPYTAEVATSSTGLNVRSGPGTTYQKIGNLEKGSTCTVITHNDEWDFIQAQGIQGYVSTAYLNPIEEVKPEPSPETTTTRLTSSTGVQIELVGKWGVS